ncbi:MAG: hypothetical protein ACXVJT_09705 [Thermoanaerobaculia bacterium]
MRTRFSLLLLSLVLYASNAFPKDVYLVVGGSVGVFRTDMRIVNPSTTKDIDIKAYLLPAGLVDNSGVQPKTITIKKRQMSIYNDVVTLLFNASGLAAIRLTSDDDFIATQRIYATTDAGTLGQFVPGLEASSAKAKGIITQLKASPANTGKGTFRTNLGVVNPNSTAAHVTWRLYDKDNNIVTTGPAMNVPPFGVLGPTVITQGIFFNAGTADLTDSWVSYSSDLPVFGFGSVIDNGTTDQLFVPPFEDSGIEQPAPPSATKEFDVALNSWSITISPNPNTLKTNDKVIFHIHNDADVVHGFQLNGPDGKPLISSRTYSPSEGTVDQSFTMKGQGTYFYFCTQTICGAGHLDMTGLFTLGAGSDGPGDKY